MNDQEIEYFIKSDLTWHKSTKNLDLLIILIFFGIMRLKINLTFLKVQISNFKKLKYLKLIKMLFLNELNDDVKWEQIHAKFKELVKKYHH